MMAASVIHRGEIAREEAIRMAVCKEIRQSVDVKAPVEVANREWTQFIFYAVYYRPPGPDESEAEPGAGFIRMEAIDDQTTRVTVDLNYCAHYEGTTDSEEIGKAEQHLRLTLGRYKRFIESTKEKRFVRDAYEAVQELDEPAKA
jgi:hypothetical protein